MINFNKGFTLIELMIVIAILGVLLQIAIPLYNQFISKVQEGACLSEAKQYTNEVFLNLNDQDESSSPSAPNVSACGTITDASQWTFENQQVIQATAKSPSNAQIECDLPNGSACRVLK